MTAAQGFSGLPAAAERLGKIYQADSGMYCLGLHACLEGWLRSKGYFSGTDPFYSGLAAWDTTGQHATLVGLLVRQHQLTNSVRHHFRKLSREEAVALTETFIRFWGKNNIPEAELAPFHAVVQSEWHRGSGSGEDAELQAGLEQLRRLQEQNRELTEQLAEYRAAQQEQDLLQSRISGAEARIKELEQEREGAGQIKEKLDRLRRDKAELQTKMLQLTQQQQKYSRLEELIGYTRRFALLSRSRMEYEKSLQQLTPEQQRIVAEASLDGAMMIRGGAGTGKTTVLLAQLQKALSEGASARFLTYTKVLTGFNRYISGVMGISLEEDGVGTVFSFLFSMLHRYRPKARVIFKEKELQGVVDACGFTAMPLDSAQLVHEAEQVVWGRMAPQENYLNGRERGCGNPPLSRERRELVWEQIQRVHGECDKKNIYTANAAWVLLYRLLESDPDFAPPVDYLFVDEAQDLSTAALACLRKLAGRGVVLAADNGQSIYGAPPDYSRIGMELRGRRTRVLRTSFRSTCQLHAVSEKFRQLCGQTPEDEGTVPFRQGMPPQYYEDESATKLYRPLAETARMLVDQLGYSPGNLAVIAPVNFYKSVERELQQAGLTAEQMKGDGFNFDCRGESVLLVTPQSAKGVDFPVVLQLIPGLEHLCYGADEEQLRNLVYVGMTRAMDALYIFAKREPESPVYQDLQQALGGEGSGTAK